MHMLLLQTLPQQQEVQETSQKKQKSSSCAGQQMAATGTAAAVVRLPAPVATGLLQLQLGRAILPCLLAIQRI
jgi:hypothetical protein